MMGDLDFAGPGILAVLLDRHQRLAIGVAQDAATGDGAIPGQCGGRKSEAEISEDAARIALERNRRMRDETQQGAVPGEHKSFFTERSQADQVEAAAAVFDASMEFSFFAVALKHQELLQIALAKGGRRGRDQRHSAIETQGRHYLALAPVVGARAEEEKCEGQCAHRADSALTLRWCSRTKGLVLSQT